MKPIVLVPVALLAAAGYVAYELATGSDPLAFERVEAGADAVVLYGNVEIRDARLAFNGAEHVAEVLVEEGDAVEPGQRLATLVTDRLDAAVREAEGRRDAQREVLRRLENGTRPQELEQARAALRSAEARVANARRQVERLTESTPSGATSQQDLDDAEARVAVEEAAVDVARQALELAELGPREEELAQARAQLAQFEAALAGRRAEREDAVLLAPSAGVVQSRILEPGEYATPDRPVLTLALTAEKWIRAYVSEPDLGRVRLGSAASVTSDSFPDERFAGQVGFISPIAEFTPKTVQTTELRPQLVYEIRVRVEDPDDRLRLGQPVTVEVESSRTEAARSER